MDVMEIRFEFVDWVQLAQDRRQLWASLKFNET
jgi:hypothetical protein